MTWPELQAGLMSLDLPNLSVEQLRALLKFGVPSREEAAALELYLQVWLVSFSQVLVVA